MDRGHRQSGSASTTCIMYGGNRAFTLLELLVTISILAVLAAILLPSVSVVRDVAMSSRCASQQGQIGLAVSMYAGSWEGLMPYIYTGTPKTSSYRTWVDHVVDEVPGLESVLRCPAHQRPKWTVGSAQDHSYLANHQYWRPADNPRYGILAEPTTAPIPLDAINGAGTVLTADGTSFSKFTFAEATSVVDELADAPRWYDSHIAFPGDLVARHRRRLMACFVDGHAQSLTIGEISNTPNPAASPRIYPLLTRSAD